MADRQAVVPESLDRFQRWMFEVVTHPDGVAGGLASADSRRHIDVGPLDIETVVNPSNELVPHKRLGVYADMYYWRLIDILADTFPTVCHVLGRDKMNEVSRAYIARHPSTHYNLGHLGDHYAEFLRHEAGVDRRGFLAAVAEVEFKMDVVFDAEEAAPLDAEVVLSIPPDAWSDARLELIPAHALLELEHDVDDYIASVREDRHLDLPVTPKASWMLIYRRRYSVWRLSIDEAAYGILCALRDGETLMEAIEKTADVDGVDAETLPSRLGQWFQAWTGAGIFRALDAPGLESSSG